MRLSLKRIMTSMVLVFCALGCIFLHEIHEFTLKNIAVVIGTSYFVFYLVERYVPEPETSGESRSRVLFEMDGKGIRRLEEGRFVEGVEWANLVRVAIRTTSAGPWGEDFYFMLVDKDEKGCLIPQLWPRFQELLQLLQKLPGFDDKAVIQASGCTSDMIFECWKGSPGEASCVSEELAALTTSEGF